MGYEQGLLPSWRDNRGNDPLYCPECHRFAQFKRAKLLKRFGPDKPMPTMLRDLKPCDIGNSISGPQCQLRYWDSMTPEAAGRSHP
jgi:hypothetical protein